MGRIIVSENISVDGVTQDPWGDDGLSFGGWHHRVSERDRAAWAEVEYLEAVQASALLLGGRTYEFFAPRWTERPGDWGDRMREIPKFVVSTTISDPTWVTTTVIDKDPIAEVASLKRSVDGDIVVYGSGRLVRTLMHHDLVDEIRLMTFPFILGGEPFFDTSDAETRLTLLGTDKVGESLTLTSYAVHPAVRN